MYLDVYDVPGQKIVLLPFLSTSAFARKHLYSVIFYDNRVLLSLNNKKY